MKSHQEVQSLLLVTYMQLEIVHSFWTICTFRYCVYVKCHGCSFTNCNQFNIYCSAQGVTLP